MSLPSWRPDSIAELGVRVASPSLRRHPALAGPTSAQPTFPPKPLPRLDHPRAPPTMTPLPRAFMIGAHRSGGLKLLPLLSAHLNVVGIAPPSAFVVTPFPAGLLAATLRAFHPPIQVLTLGGKVHPPESSIAKQVWEEYRAEVEAKPDEYGAEVDGVKVGVVDSTNEEMIDIIEKEGVKGYDAVAKALLRGLERLKHRKTHSG